MVGLRPGRIEFEDVSFFQFARKSLFFARMALLAKGP